MKMIKMISIITLCLTANLMFSAEFATGEMSISKASETFGNGCCQEVFAATCSWDCSISGDYVDSFESDSGWNTCTVSGTNACGDCENTGDWECDGSGCGD